MLKVKNAAPGLRVKNAGMRLDLKSVGDDGTIEGYASAWNIVDSYNEAVLPGAFKVSLANGKRDQRRVKMLYQHDTYTPVGVWDELVEDSTGLHAKGRLLIEASPKALEVYGLVKAEALDELSIGYREIETKKDPTNPKVLLLKTLDLREISIVTFGALGRAAHIDSVKSILEGGELPTVREFEGFLRDAGFSKSLAATIASKATPHLRGDPEAKADDVIAFLKAFERA